MPRWYAFRQLASTQLHTLSGPLFIFLKGITWTECCWRCGQQTYQMCLGQNRLIRYIYDNSSSYVLCAKKLSCRRFCSVNLSFVQWCLHWRTNKVLKLLFCKEVRNVSILLWFDYLLVIKKIISSLKKCKAFVSTVFSHLHSPGESRLWMDRFLEAWATPWTSLQQVLSWKKKKTARHERHSNFRD